MIGVAMRQDDEIEVSKVNALRINVGGEYVAIVAGVEQDSLTRHLDERGEAPILSHCSVLAEGVVENRDLPCARLRVGRRDNDCCSYHRASRKHGGTKDATPSYQKSFLILAVEHGVSFRGIVFAAERQRAYLSNESMAEPRCASSLFLVLANSANGVVQCPHEKGLWTVLPDR